MKHLSNSHEIVDQNDNTVKKSQKHEVNVQKNTTLYFQIGLILALLATYALFEMEFARSPIVVMPPPIDDTEQLFTSEIAIYTPPEVKEVKKQTPTKQKRIITTPIITVTNKITKVETPLITEPSLSTQPNTSMSLPNETKPKGPMSMIGVEKLPIFPGCEGLTGRQAQMDCLNNKIEKLIGRKFNADVTEGLGLSGINRIFVRFTIDENGYVTDIQTQGPHYKLEKEALRVINKIPQMTPGKQNNKAVSVVYNLPITLKIE